MKDRRNTPWCWQEHRAVEAIHGRWAGRERTTALAIYQAMTYLASIRYRDGGRDGFAATRAEIAERAGSKPATVDGYARDFVQLGLLGVERRKSERGRDLASLWTLKSPTGGGPQQAPIPEGAPVDGSRRGTPEGSSTAPEEEPPTRARGDAVQEERQDAPQPPASGGRKRDQQRFEDECARYGAEHFLDLGVDAGPAVAQAVRNGARVLPEVREFVDRWWREPRLLREADELEAAAS